MASTVSIELDLAVVQEAIHAKVQPAVEAILSTVDLPSLIEKALLKEQPIPSRYSLTAMMYWADSRLGRPIDALVDDALAEAAKAYVAAAVKAERPKIEAAFQKMLSNSSSKLARTMFRALNGALESDWGFTINTQIEAKEPSRYDD